MKEVTNKDLYEYVRYLCKKYNELSGKIALSEAGAYVEMSCHEVGRKTAIVESVLEICEMLEVKPPKREEIEGSARQHDEKYTYSYYAFVDYKNWHIAQN